MVSPENFSQIALRISMSALCQVQPSFRGSERDEAVATPLAWHLQEVTFLCKPLETMIQNLTELYHEQLKDLYSAELQTIDGLGEMIRTATNERLKEAFANHLKETHEQRHRLETIMGRRGISPGQEECQAMKGLIKEAQHGIGQTEPGCVRDAVLIASANRIEHYEIAGYGVARAFAQCLEYSDDADLLDQTLQEEGSADHKLTELAIGSLFRDGINEAATNEA